MIPSQPATPPPTDGRRLPPSPHYKVRELVRDPLAFFLSISRQYGDVVCYRRAPDPAYLVNHPDYIHHVLVANQRSYSKDTFTNAAFKAIVGSSLINLEGGAWLQRRRLMQPAFHHTRLGAQSGMIVQAANDMLARWQVSFDEGRPIDVAREMSSLTMTIASRALFGVGLEDEAAEIGEIINRAAEYVEKPHDPRLKQSSAEFAALVDRIILKRRSDFQDQGDLLSSMMTARAEDTGLVLDDQQLRNEVMDLLLAGNDTTANALTWTLYLLSQNLWASDRLRSEVRQSLAGRLPDSAGLERLPYLRLVLYESLRLFPPAWIIGRRALVDDEIGGYHVPAGTVIAVCIYALHRHPAFWESPDEFDPQRFTPERSAGRSKNAYIPFGAGPRLCIGSEFGLLESGLILACIAQRFELRLQEGIQVQPRPLFVLRPNRDFLMTLHP
jgi:cytochrome P450